MSESKITELEKDMAVLKSIVPPLMEKMDKSTEAQIGLTNEIKNLVESSKKSEGKIEDMDERIHSLEAKELVRQSGDQVVSWVKKGFITAIVGAITGLIIISKG
jgi:septal ring factor EnvC (AmiA/AmiB activator)